MYPALMKGESTDMGPPQSGASMLAAIFLQHFPHLMANVKLPPAG